MKQENQPDPLASSVVRLVDVHKSYPSGSGAVLRGIDLEVAAGETVVVQGVSGCGKSTLLNLIGGLDQASRGQVFACSAELGTLSKRALTLFRRERVGFIFQSYNLLPTLTALENVRLGLESTLRTPQGVNERALALLREVGLEAQAHKFPEQMSGGEQQRAAIARALVKKPPLLLADEPTGSLDEQTSRSVIELLTALRKRAGTTMVLVTHDPAIAELADRQLRLQDGRLVEPAAG